jgi:hypothetical protein
MFDDVLFLHISFIATDISFIFTWLLYFILLMLIELLCILHILRHASHTASLLLITTSDISALVYVSPDRVCRQPPPEFGEILKDIISLHFRWFHLFAPRP